MRLTEKQMLERFVRNIDKKRCIHSRICLGELIVNHKSPAEHRFWKNVCKTPNCWNWVNAAYSHNGYGYFVVNRKNVRAHRYSYELHIGPIPVGKDVLHTCDNPACVNPKHLFLGNATINQADKVRKNRQAKGETQGSVVLTEVQVREIRKSARPFVVTLRFLAKKYGVSRSTIHSVLTRDTWNHVK